MEQLAAAAAAQGSEGGVIGGGTPSGGRRGEPLGARRAHGGRPARALNPSVRAARARRPSERLARFPPRLARDRGWGEGDREREGRHGSEGTVLSGLGKGRGSEAMR